MIYEELENTIVRELDYTTRFNVLGDWPTLTREMQSWTKPHEALTYLKVECETRKRQYYVQRLYGRYRKLLPNEDMPELMKYMVDYVKTPKG